MPGKPWTQERADLAQEIGQRIRAAREASRYRYSIRDLAGIVKVGSNAIWNIEVGNSLPDTETLMRIAAALGVTTESLLPLDYQETLRPPDAVLEWLGRRAPFPEARPAASGESATAKRRSSSRSKGDVVSSASSGRRAGADPRKQRRRKSGSKRREGGFSTTPVRPAA